MSRSGPFDDVEVVVSRSQDDKRTGLAAIVADVAVTATL